MIFFIYIERSKAWDVAAKKTIAKATPFGINVEALRPNSPTIQSKIDTFLKFAFQMDSIILNLFTGNIKSI